MSAPERVAASVPPKLKAGRYDSGERRQATRPKGYKGCRVYIPAEELVKAGIDPDGPPPRYRTWGSARGSVLVRLYAADVKP